MTHDELSKLEAGAAEEHRRFCTGPHATGHTNDSEACLAMQAEIRRVHAANRAALEAADAELQAAAKAARQMESAALSRWHDKAHEAGLDLPTRMQRAEAVLAEGRLDAAFDVAHCTAQAVVAEGYL